MKRVEIVTIGNEILLGAVLDSNSNWLCKQISGLAGQVERVVLVRDDVAVIAREIESALSRQADITFTIGGLGPTADDLTLEALAKATGRDLEPNDEALALVRSRYEKFYEEGSVDSPTLSEARRKMGILPKGSHPLPNNVGAAPAVLLHLPAGQIIVSLPGVPTEMKDIFTNSLAETLRSVFGSGAFVQLTLVTDCKDESALSPTLRRVAEQYSDVYIKSRPKTFGPHVRLHITIALRGESRPKITERLKQTQRALEIALREQGVNILEERTE